MNKKPDTNKTWSELNQEVLQLAGMKIASDPDEELKEP
jgi:hypothetical protein